MSRILIVDDEQSMRQMVAIALRQEGYDVVIAEDGEVASRELQASKVDVVVSDIKMPGLNGIDLLRFARENSPATEVILMTAYTSTESAIEALRLGAYDYISKPFEIDDLKATVGRALERAELRSQNKLLRRQLSTRHKVGDLIGRSPGMLRVFDLIQRLTDSEITVLITGESGTGKELVARAIHNEGVRSAEPFITINCAAMPPQLLESELFGHMRGSFTGADRDKQGLFVAAAGGTLVLDEIGELPMEMQPKLLRVLEDHKVRPVGATAETHIDVRILAATNRDLQREAAEGRFREDLFYRLNVIQIDLPSLRERTEDIMLLADHFLENIVAADEESVLTGFSSEVKDLFLRYPWPGNVRELDNAVRRAATFEGGTVIQAENLPDSVRAGGAQAGKTLNAGPRTGESRLQDQMLGDLDAAAAGAGADPAIIPDEGLDLEEHLAEIRSGYMIKALAEAGGVQKKAAAKLGMSFRSFRYYLDKLGLRGGEGS